ncbi:MAG: hypothetical protein NTW19_07765 [Planctomycetota bacterium]|nr:hypothetical protein [Planctomycetota bacterium]
MSDWLASIEANAQAAGYPHRTWEAGDGRLLLTPHGGRLIGCEIPGIEGNLFWHNPNLEDPDKAASGFRAGGAGIGGDRLWLGPEIGLHWPDLKKARKSPWDDYFVPASVDPGEYKVMHDQPGHLRLAVEMKVKDHRLKLDAHVGITRQFDAIARPDGLPRGLKCVSFAIENHIKILDAKPGIGVGTWDILQIPAGGTLVCPTTVKVPRPRIYYGKFTPTHFTIKSDAVRFKIDGKKQLKFGLDAVRTTGRMGYLRKVGKVTTLIFRAFAPLPGQPYVDLPLASDDLVGCDALQSYNDGGMFGGFGEMEYHDPALIAGNQPVARTGSCVTHVISGPDAKVRQAAAMLLGTKV